MITITYMPTDQGNNVMMRVSEDLFEKTITALISAGCLILEVK